MTPDELGNGIKYLKAFYTRWEFDVTNTFALQVWYQSLQNLSFEQLKAIIQTYCMNNQFPPNSPYDLLNLIPKYDDIETVCNKIRDIADRNSNPEYFMREVYNKLPNVYPMLKGIDDMFYEKDSFGNKCIGYALRVFKKRYIKFLNEQKVVYIGNSLIDNTKLLGE